MRIAIATIVGLLLTGLATAAWYFQPVDQVNQQERITKASYEKYNFIPDYKSLGKTRVDGLLAIAGGEFDKATELEKKVLEFSHKQPFLVSHRLESQLRLEFLECEVPKLNSNEKQKLSRNFPLKMNA